MVMNGAVPFTLPSKDDITLCQGEQVPAAARLVESPVTVRSLVSSQFDNAAS